VRPYERTQANNFAGRALAAPPAKLVTGRTVLFSVLAFFGVVIGVNTLMAFLAINTMPGTEIENPYQAGIAYNVEIGAARDQAARHWRVASHIERDPSGRATVKVEARDRGGAPLTNLALTIRLVRPTDQRADRIVTLTERESGRYHGETADVIAGVWEIELKADRGKERVFRSKNRITLE
jgi:nitrogen fixation protein FixH